MFIDRLLALVSRSGSFRKKGQGLGEYGMIIGAVSISTMIALAPPDHRLLDLLSALEAGVPWTDCCCASQSYGIRATMRSTSSGAKAFRVWLLT